MLNRTDQNELIFQMQRIAFAKQPDIEGNKRAEQFKKIAINALLTLGITQPKTFCKICWNEIPNEGQDIIYFCDDCQKECDPYNNNKK